MSSYKTNTVQICNNVYWNPTELSGKIKQKSLVASNNTHVWATVTSQKTSSATTLLL